MAQAEHESNTGQGGESRFPVDLSLLEPFRRIPGRNSTKADILFCHMDDGDVAIKDYSERSLLVRNTIGRWLINREARAYAGAAGVKGLPRFLGKVGKHALATRLIDGVPLAEFDRSDVDNDTFDRVAGILDALHRRGVAISDLHHRDVLVSPDGDVHLVDMATAWLLGDRPGSIRRRLFERFRRQDLVSLARMRARFTGTDESEAIAAVCPGAVARHARWRRFKRIWNRLRGRRYI